MRFYRTIEKDLLAWSQRPHKKPLILNGARQVGKTTLIKQFGQSGFKGRLGSVAYFNLEKQVELHDFFKVTKDPNRILRSLNLTLDEPIEPERTLIFFDEIQACGEALTALKYFQEEAPEYSVIAAGSLLGVSLNEHGSFPVGKVEFLELFPLSFDEFLQTADSKLHKAYLHYLSEEPIGNIPPAFFNPISELFKEYIVCGGMPEVASVYLETKSIQQATIVKKNLLRSYSSDFSKYIKRNDAVKVGYIWESLPSQLAKENKKFFYKAARHGAKAREYETALLWLIRSGLVLKASDVSVPRLPLSTYNDLTAFKLYVLDVGLLFAMSDLEPSNYIDAVALFKEFKGALTENYVAQALRYQGVEDLHYWTSAGKAELDFLLPVGQHIIPIEVKSSHNTKAKSLKVYKEKYQPELNIILSTNNLSYEGDTLRVPLFYAEQIKSFVRRIGFEDKTASK